VVESELLARLRQGDDEAYATIFREHYSWLVLSASRLLGDRSLAEEVVQDVMLELWRRRAELTLTGPLRAYLHQSARNRALNHLRHGRTVRQSEPYVRPPSAAPRPDARVSSRELQDAARRDDVPRDRERAGHLREDRRGADGTSITSPSRASGALASARWRMVTWSLDRCDSRGGKSRDTCTLDVGQPGS
jgi:RNA polymerase sigma factor (sigma-70 family)